MARKKEPPKEKEYICIIHDDISSILEEIQELDFTESTISEIPEMQKNIKISINKALKRVKDAKERGIAMERRLLEYRSAIDNLGYHRNEN